MTKGPFWFCSCRHPHAPVYYADEMDKLRDLLAEIAPDWFMEYCGNPDTTKKWAEIVTVLGFDPLEKR